MFAKFYITNNDRLDRLTVLQMPQSLENTGFHSKTVGKTMTVLYVFHRLQDGQDGQDGEDGEDGEDGH